jgi:hypothetical protein
MQHHNFSLGTEEHYRSWKYWDVVYRFWQYNNVQSYCVV